MEHELWHQLYPLTLGLGKRYCSSGVQFSDAWIVLTFLWAVRHDRPVAWACRAHNWPAEYTQPPSASTMSRRLRSPGVWQLLAAVQAHFRRQRPSSLCKWIDALPLPIGPAGRDPDARRGRGASGLAYGYKLHAICDMRGGIDAWSLVPMNRNEKAIAPQLLLQVQGPGYLVGDNQYDGNRLYELAALQDLQLVVPRRNNTRLAHQVHSPHRLRGRELESHAFGQGLLRGRFGIDRFFGQLGNCGGGLSPLPHWVRRWRRVWLWVQGKLILQAVWIAKKPGLVA